MQFGDIFGKPTTNNDLNRSNAEANNNLDQQNQPLYFQGERPPHWDEGWSEIDNPHHNVNKFQADSHQPHYLNQYHPPSYGSHQVFQCKQRESSILEKLPREEQLNDHYVSKRQRDESSECKNCGMKFHSIAELHNHMNKFCTNSGFDTLAGLNVKMHEPSNPFSMPRKKPSQSKKQKSAIDSSLTDAINQIEQKKKFIPYEKEIYDDISKFKKHEQQIANARPYIYHRSRISKSTPRSHKSHSTSSNIENLDRGRRTLDRDLPLRSSHSSSKAPQSHRNRANDNSFVSPPTQLPALVQAKHLSLLNKSDISIQQMPASERKEYVLRKLLQLESILQNFKKNGGKDEKFEANIAKMIKFYQGLRSEIQARNDTSKFGEPLRDFRPDTPISKLKKLQQSNVINESIVKTNFTRTKAKIEDAYRLSLARKQDRIKKRMTTEVENPSSEFIRRSQVKEQLQKMLKKQHNQNKNQSPVIVIPVNQPENNKQSVQANRFDSGEFRHFEDLMKMKSTENQKLVELISKMTKQQKLHYEGEIRKKEKDTDKKLSKLESKLNELSRKNENEFDRRLENSVADRRGSNQQGYFNTSNPFRRRIRTEYSKPEYVSAKKVDEDTQLRELNIEKSGFYDEDKADVTYEEKILLQMQKEERDELQLLSHLPEELQQIKLESIESMAKKRHEMEQEVLKQKIAKLNLEEEMQGFEQQRKLFNEDLANEQRKLSIHRLMKKKVKAYAEEVYREDMSEDSEDERRYQNVMNNENGSVQDESSSDRNSANSKLN